MGPRLRRIAWSAGAHRDLDEAAAYIAEDSLRNASRLVSRLLDAAESLAHLPERGRTVPERNDPQVRELLVNPYRLIYWSDDEAAVILGVLHQRRDFERSALPDRSPTP